MNILKCICYILKYFKTENKLSLIVTTVQWGVPAGDAPTWNSTPVVIVLDEAVAQNFDLTQYTQGATSYAWDNTSTALPSGMTVSGTNLAYDGGGTNGETTSVRINAINVDGTVASSNFSITITATPVGFIPFPIFDFYQAIANLRGFSVIPAINTRFWTKPVYPVAATQTGTTLTDFETKCNAANPGHVIFLQDGTYATQNITVTASGTAANPITICAATLGGADVGDSQFRIDGHFVNVYGFVGARFDANGQDGVYAYNQRSATEFTFFLSDGYRNRFCYNTASGLTANDQYWNVENPTYIIIDNRIDHNHFLRHIGSDLPSGGSEHGQVGQDSIEKDYRLYFDSNYCFEHLNDGTGTKTIALESELISFKSSKNMCINNYFKDCNSHVSLRTPRQTTVWANWFSGDNANQAGGATGYGPDNLWGCNYFIDMNAAELDGEAAIDVGGGSSGNREAADDSEVVFNTAYDCRKIFSLNRANYAIKPTNVQIFSNAFKKHASATANTLWDNDSTTPNFGANVFSAPKGIADADVLEATPGFSLVSGYYVPTVAGNLDGTSDAISVMGPMVQALSTAGMLIDILGNQIPTTGADQGAIQTGYDLTTNPITYLVNNSGYAA